MKHPLLTPVSRIFFTLILIFSIVPVVHADEITDAINEGLKHYQDGNFTGAAGSLDYAAQLIRQKKGGALTSLLPNAIEGWTAEEPTSQAAGAAMMGGGVSAERKYNKEESNITIQYMADSPLMQGVMMMFNNPMFASSDGGKLETISGQRAIVKYNATDKNGDVKIVVANRYLITVEGSGVTKEDLVAYVKLIDFTKMAALP